MAMRHVHPPMQIQESISGIKIVMYVACQKQELFIPIVFVAQLYGRPGYIVPSRTIPSRLCDCLEEPLEVAHALTRTMPFFNVLPYCISNGHAVQFSDELRCVFHSHSVLSLFSCSFLLLFLPQCYYFYLLYFCICFTSVLVNLSGVGLSLLFALFPAPFLNVLVRSAFLSLLCLFLYAIIYCDLFLHVLLYCFLYLLRPFLLSFLYLFFLYSCLCLSVFFLSFFTSFFRSFLCVLSFFPFFPAFPSCSPSLSVLRTSLPVIPGQEHHRDCFTCKLTLRMMCQKSISAMCRTESQVHKWCSRFDKGKHLNNLCQYQRVHITIKSCITFFSQHSLRDVRAHGLVLPSANNYHSCFHMQTYVT